MTPSIDERRKVAERLRYVGRSGGPEWGTAACCIAECVGEDDYPLWGGSIPLFEKLADLIEPLPERTCRVEYRYRDDEPWPYAACSECGAALSYYDTVDERGEELSDLCPFCPNCGAKVVEP